MQPAAAPDHAVQALPDAPGHDEHEHIAAPAGPLFTEAEWKEFKHDDIRAGGGVVCLMGGIFTIGAMLYTTIALIVGG
jgi:hypothetical protein